MGRMKVHIKVSEVEDAFELLDIVKKLRNVRESIYSGTVEDFTMEINSKLVTSLRSCCSCKPF